MSRVGADDIVLRRTRRRSRAVVTVPLVSLAILVVGWSVLWSVARWQAGVALDRVIADEAAHGRTWSCPERTITGFPFRIALDCPGLTFAGVVDGSPAEGRLGSLAAETYLYEPSSVYVTLAGPMSLTSQDGRGDFSLGWAAFRATVRGLWGGLARVEVSVDGAVLARPGIDPMRAEHVELHAGPATGRPPEEAADTVDLALTGAAAPFLDAVTGDTAPLGGSVTGTITHAYGDLPDLGTATVERWRRAGGHLDIADLKLVKGALSATASGQLGLDPQHRLAGQLAARLAGFAPLAKRFGIPLGAVEVGGLLTSLFGKRAGSPPAASAPGAVDLPITFADGAVSIGPVQLPVALRPLY